MKVKKVKRSSIVSKAPIEISDAQVNGDRISVGGSVKISRKLMPEDIFVTVDASCMFSTSAPKGKRKSVAEDSGKFVRSVLKVELDKNVEWVRKQIED